MSLEPIPPHPKLDRFYAREEDRLALVREVFDEGAEHYEWICRADHRRSTIACSAFDRSPLRAI